MRAGSLLAEYTAASSKGWKEIQLQRAQQAEQRLLEELNGNLATITADTLRLIIDGQSHLIDIQNEVIVYLHLNDGSIISTERLKPLLENSTELKRLKELAKNEGFVNLAAVPCESATKIGFDLLLKFKLPN